MVPARPLRRAVRSARFPDASGVVVPLSVLAIVFLYDLLGPGVETLPHGFEPRKIDWLLALSLVFFAWYGTAAVLGNPGRTRRALRDFGRRPGALFAGVALAVLAGFGLVGPVLLGDPSPTLSAKLQPPVYAESTAPGTLNCVGESAGRACRGTWQYPLGTDKIGRNLVALLASGARVTLVVALVTGTLIVPVAIAVGLTAAYVGGRVDDALMRYVDVQRTVPAFIVYLILRFLFGSSLFLFVLVFGFLSWGGVARIVRSDAIRYRDSAQVDAAVSVGAGHLHVLRRYFLPKVSPAVIAATTRELPALVLAQAALAFLKLHDVMVPSWGRTISNGMVPQPSLFWAQWWTWAVPTVALVLTVVALSVFGNALQEVLDPRRA